jgi:uroporphyrinogen III methyltransferase/synthase
MPGKVYLVGAGPGDPGLLTARAVELIAIADAILHDRLIPQAALAGAREDAILDHVGKQHSGDSAKQADIEARMLELAREGKTVVRLKGGDPFVFGRGAEEAAALVREGIEFEIVPGITAGVAAAAYAGIPVTHRAHAAAVAFVTGHEDPEKDSPQLDWAALSAFPGTLVFYMGVKNLELISRELIAGGRPADQPAAAVERGTTARQRTIVGTLATLPELASEAGLRPPALTVIGDVVSERETIAWFEARPLLGRKIAVTRTRAQASVLAARLTELGADVVQAPAIRTRELDSAELTETLEHLSDYSLIAFSSGSAVEAFFSALARAGLDSRALHGIEIAAVGKATSAALAARGIAADHVPTRQTSEGLLDALEGVASAEGRVLIPRAAGGRTILIDGLRTRGANVEAVNAYETIAEQLSPEQLEAITGAEFITFASGSAVHSIVEALGGTDQLTGAKLVSIGPATTHALTEHGLAPTLEATQSDVDGLIDAVLSLA